MAPLLPPPLGRALRRRLAVPAAVACVLAGGGAVVAFNRPDHATATVHALAGAAPAPATPPPPASRPPAATTAPGGPGSLTPALVVRPAAHAPPGPTPPGARIAPPAPRPPDATPGASAVSGAVRPPAFGTYDYRGTVDGDPVSDTLVLTPAATALGPGQHQAYTGAGPAQDEVVAWRADHEWLVRSGSCAWSSPVALLVLPLRRGASWSSDASCAAGARTTVTMHMTTRVATAAAVSSGGKATPVWVLERRVVLTAASAVATGTSEAAWSELVAPASGLTVFEDGKASVPTTTGEQSTTWTSELQ